MTDMILTINMFRFRNKRANKFQNKTANKPNHNDPNKIVKPFKESHARMFLDKNAEM